MFQKFHLGLMFRSQFEVVLELQEAYFAFSEHCYRVHGFHLVLKGVHDSKMSKTCIKRLLNIMKNCLIQDIKWKKNDSLCSVITMWVYVTENIH